MNSIKNFKNFIIHLTPKSSPIILIPILILIEIIRFSIRPLTLGLRLIANIIAGHIIISLLRSNIINKNSILLTFIQILISILERLVSLIQAYVFSLLTCLYIESSIQ